MLPIDCSARWYMHSSLEGLEWEGGGGLALVRVLAQKVKGIGNVHGAVGGSEVYGASQVDLKTPRQVSVDIHSFRRKIDTYNAGASTR
jgi:hypothetical protein